MQFVRRKFAARGAKLQILRNLSSGVPFNFVLWLQAIIPDTIHSYRQLCHLLVHVWSLLLENRKTLCLLKYQKISYTIGRPSVGEIYRNNISLAVKSKYK